jgi:hypothetical protein
MKACDMNGREVNVGDEILIDCEWCEIVSIENNGVPRHDTHAAVVNGRPTSKWFIEGRETREAPSKKSIGIVVDMNGRRVVVGDEIFIDGAWREIEALLPNTDGSVAAIVKGDDASLHTLSVRMTREAPSKKSILVVKAPSKTSVVDDDQRTKSAAILAAAQEYRDAVADDPVSQPRCPDGYLWSGRSGACVDQRGEPTLSAEFVQPGDTLENILERTGLTLDELKEHNPRFDETRLTKGDLISVPISLQDRARRRRIVLAISMAAFAGSTATAPRFPLSGKSTFKGGHIPPSVAASMPTNVDLKPIADLAVAVDWAMALETTIKSFHDFHPQSRVGWDINRRSGVATVQLVFRIEGLLENGKPVAPFVRELPVMRSGSIYLTSVAYEATSHFMPIMARRWRP